MNATAQRNLGELLAGRCYDCGGRLKALQLDGRRSCVDCGRSFLLREGVVVERIPMGDEWRGVTCELASDAWIVLADGSIVKPHRDAGGSAVLPHDVVALEVDWQR